MRRCIVITIVIIISLFTASLARSEIFTWTDENGAFNSTDDPSRVPRKIRQKAKIVSTETKLVLPDISGQWWNKQSRFASLGYYFADRGRGFYLTGVSVVPPESIPKIGSDFHWAIDNSGNITLTFDAITKRKPMIGCYNAEIEEICFYDDEGCNIKFWKVKGNMDSGYQGKYDDSNKTKDSRLSTPESSLDLFLSALRTGNLKDCKVSVTGYFWDRYSASSEQAIKKDLLMLDKSIRGRIISKSEQDEHRAVFRTKRNNNPIVGTIELVNHFGNWKVNRLY